MGALEQELQSVGFQVKTYTLEGKTLPGDQSPGHRRRCLPHCHGMPWNGLGGRDVVGQRFPTGGGIQREAGPVSKIVSADLAGRKSSSRALVVHRCLRCLGWQKE